MMLLSALPLYLRTISMIGNVPRREVEAFAWMQCLLRGFAVPLQPAMAMIHARRVQDASQRIPEPVISDGRKVNTKPTALSPHP